MFDKIFNGPPSTVASPSSTASGIDTANQNLYLSGANGWIAAAPSTVAKNGLTTQSANVANVLTFAVPGNLSGVYELSIFETSDNTPTGATLPAVTATFTEKDTNTSVTETLADVGSVSGPNVTNNGVLILHPKAGTNVVVATTSYAAGSGTALTYSVHVRLVYLG